MWPGAWGHKFPLRKRRCKIFNKLLVDTANMNGETGRESFVPNRCCYIHEFSKCVHKGSRAHVSRCSFTFGCISEYNIKLYIYIYYCIWKSILQRRDVSVHKRSSRWIAVFTGQLPVTTETKCCPSQRLRSIMKLHILDGLNDLIE